MDKFEKALAVYRLQEDKIAELKFLNQEYRDSLPQLLNDHIACVSIVPHLKSDKFSDKWMKYSQKSTVVPFIVKQIILFTQDNEHSALIIDNTFGVRNYDNYFKTGDIELLNYNLVFLEEGLKKISDEVDFTEIFVDRVGNTNNNLSQTVKLDSRYEVGNISTKEIFYEFNKKILDNIKNEKNNPTFNLSSKNKEEMLVVLNDRTNDLIQKILSRKLYENPEDIMNETETKVLGNISQVVLKNDLVTNLAENTNKNKLKTKI